MQPDRSADEGKLEVRRSYKTLREQNFKIDTGAYQYQSLIRVENIGPIVNSRNFGTERRAHKNA